MEINNTQQIHKKFCTKRLAQLHVVVYLISPATDDTVPVKCVWRHILVERASAHMLTLIHQLSMHKHRRSTTVLHQLGVWQWGWCGSI